MNIWGFIDLIIKLGDFWGGFEWEEIGCPEFDYPNVRVRGCSPLSLG